MGPWYLVTDAGDSAVLLPLAAALALWLVYGARAPRDAGRFLMAVALCALPIVVSKLLFMGWDIGIKVLDFTGISGHTALSSLIYPAVALCLPERKAWRAASLSIASVLVVEIAASRVATHAHSVAEVTVALAWGGLLATWFWSKGDLQMRQLGEGRRLILGGLVVALFSLCHGHRVPTQQYLVAVAKALTHRADVFHRID